MIIDKSKLKMGIWYEDKEGNCIAHGDEVDAPQNAETCHVLFPLEVVERIYKLEDYDGIRTYHGSDLLLSSTTNICGDGRHILQMANSGDFTLKEAIVVYAAACERCANALIWKYSNGEDGYPEYGEEWKRANTFCEFCKAEESE